MYGSGGYPEVVIVAGGYQLFRAWKEKDLWKRISDAEAGVGGLTRDASRTRRKQIPKG